MNGLLDSLVPKLLQNAPCYGFGFLVDVIFPVLLVSMTY